MSAQTSPPVNVLQGSSRVNMTPEGSSQVHSKKQNLASPSKEKRYWCLDDFEIGKKLGKGKFGHVYLCRTKVGHKVVALKAIDKTQLIRNNMLHQLHREIALQGTLVQDNIIRLFGFFFDSKRVYLILEYAPMGEIYEKLKSAKKFDEKQAATFVREVAKALDHCHKNGVIHRDVKPENLLIGYNDKTKLADFGNACATNSSRRNTLCGTLDYLAPEMVKNETYDHNVDVWALGVMTYEFIVGHPPFEAANPPLTFDRIRSGKFEYPDHVSAEARDLINSLLRVNPQERLHLDQLETHPWIQKHCSD